MLRNHCTNLLLVIIAIALVAIATRPFVVPPVVAAQSTPYAFYFEPGTQMLRSPDGRKRVNGRVVVDMRTGTVWGFPTNTPDTYPVNPLNTRPMVSHPFELGKFAFEDTNR